MFYDVYSYLAKEKNVSPTGLAQSLGINKSNVSNWKNNGYTPRGAVLNKIADALDVNADYLLAMSDYSFCDEWEDDEWEDWRNAASDDEKRKMLKSFGICRSVLSEAESVLNVSRNGNLKNVGDLTFDDFTYALHNEAQNLTEENKKKLLEMARLFKMSQLADNGD